MVFLDRGVRDELDSLQFSNKSLDDMASLDWEQQSQDQIDRLASVQPAHAATTSSPQAPVFEAPPPQSLALPRRASQPDAGQLRTVWKADPSQPDVFGGPPLVSSGDAGAGDPGGRTAPPAVPADVPSRWQAGAQPAAASGTPVAMPSGQPTSSGAPETLGPISEGDPQAFFATAGPYARQVERDTGIPAALTLAVAANETGYGQRRYMAGNNNYFGIQAQPGEAGAVPYKDWRPGPNGEQQFYNAAQRSFADPLAAFYGFASFLQDNPRYGPALARYRQTGDVNQLAAGIKDAGYAEDPQYATKIQSIMRGIPVSTGVGEVTAPAGVSSTIQNTPAAAVSPPARPSAGASSAQQQGGSLDIGDVAQRYGGGTYVFGGGRDAQGGIPGDPNSDCSAFVSGVWRERGLNLTAHTDGAYNQLKQLGARQVSEAEAQPGDVVFYMGSGYGGNITYHMGIYAGPGQILDQSRWNGDSGVKVRPLSHAGGPDDIVILRDPRVNGRPPRQASEAPPPIRRSGIAESPLGDRITQAAGAEAQASAYGDNGDVQKLAADVPDTGLSAGDQKRAKLAAANGQQDMLRQPLGPQTSGPDTFGTDQAPAPSSGGPEIADVRDADSGPHELPPPDLQQTSPATYGQGADDPGTAPLPFDAAPDITYLPSTAPLVSDQANLQEMPTRTPASAQQAQPATYGASGDDAGQAASPSSAVARQVPVWDNQGVVVGYRQQDEPPSGPSQYGAFADDPGQSQGTGVNPLVPGSLRPTDLPPEMQGARPWLPATTPAGGIQPPPGLVDTLVPRAAQTGPLFDEPTAPSRWSPQFQNAYANPSYEAAPFQDDQREPATGYRPAPRVLSPYTPGTANAMAGVETPPSDQQILQGQGTVARGIDTFLQQQGIEDQHPETLVSPENRRAFMQDNGPTTAGQVLDWRDRLTVGAADAIARGIGSDPEQTVAQVTIAGHPIRMTVSDLIQNVTDPLFIGGAGVGQVVLDGVGAAALHAALPYLKGAARGTVGRLLQGATIAGDAIEAGGHRALDAMEAGGARVAGAFRAGRRVAAEANAADAGGGLLATAGAAPPPEPVRIPGAGSTSDLRPGAEAMIRQDVARNAVDEPLRRAEVAQKAQDVLGMDPDTVQRWQDAALARDESTPVVRGEALRQARVIDAENADRAIERLRAAQQRAQSAGGAQNLGADEKFDAADALLQAAEAARAMQRSGAADTAEARAAARQLGQRRQAITAAQAYESALRARQVGQDAAFAAQEVQRAARTGQVTPQGEARLRVLRDKLLDAERNGLVGDGAGGRLAALEQPTTAAATVGTAPNVRPGVPLGTQIASRAGASLAGGVMGAATGAALPADTPEERRRNALLGAGVGLVGGPLIQRAIGRGRGAMGLLGSAPEPGVPNRAIAIGADPAKRYEFRYRVVDLGDLVPSNLPTGAPNPAFPRELQPRARERAASQLQIDQIARGLEPDVLLTDVGRLDAGPMIVGPDRVVESGNGRTLALQRAASEYPEQYQRYVDTLRQNLGDYGLSEADLRGIKQPVLVRERVSAVDRPAFAQEANNAGLLRMSSVEQAAQDAGNLSDAMLTGLQVGENDTIASALRKTDNRDLVRQWVGSLPENERAGVLDASGQLSAQGYERLTNALLMRTYGEGAGERLARTFIESADPTVRNVQTALMASLPDVARSESLIRSGQRDAGLSISGDVAAATEMLARLRRDGIKVGDYLGQAAMFERELTPMQEEILQFLDRNQRRPSVIREALKEYASRVENAADPNQVDMFGGQIASPSREDLWRGATAGAPGPEITPLEAASAAAGRAPADGAGLAQPAAESVARPIDIPPAPARPAARPQVAAPRTPAADIVPSTGGPEGNLAVEGAPEPIRRPGPVGSVPAGGPEGSLAVQGAPQPTPRPGALPDNVAPRGGPEGTLTQEGAPTRLAAPMAAERGTLPAGGPEGRLTREGAPPEAANLPAPGDFSTGGPEGTLTLSSGRSVKDVADQIDRVLANPRAPDAAARLQQLHQDLQEISTQGFQRSSDIRRRLQRQGLLRAGLASQGQNVDGLVQALANVDPAHPEQMQAVLQIISKPRLIDRILEYQYVNMLSSPITQAVNVTANAMQLGGRLFFQNPLEWVYSGGQSTGVGAAFSGAARGFREALPEVRQIMRTGTSTDAVERATEMGNYSQVGRELLTEQFGKTGALLHAISTRPLQAMDALFGQMAYGAAAEQYAQRTADRLLASGSSRVKGLSREQARQYVMANIWDFPEIVEKAGKIQDYTLLRSNDASGKGLGVLERQLRQMAALGHAPADADFARQALAFGVNNVLPFFNVPLNAAKQGIERTAGVPVNVVRGVRAYRAGETERGAELMAKATIGAAALATAGVLAAGDNLTGEGPGGADQAIWELDHRRNSWRVPGTQAWFSWEGTPLAVPFGMAAGAKQGWSDASQRAQQAGKTDALDLYGTAALKAGQGAVQGFTSQSFIRAMGDQYKLLTGQETGLATVANQATSNVSRFVPASGMLNFLANVSDTMVRDPGRPQAFSDLPRNIGAREANRIPGLRQQVDPRLTPYGEPTRNEQFGVAGVLPYYRGAGVGASDPITQRLQDAGVGGILPPTEVPAGVTAGVPIPLSMQQQRVFSEAAGRRFRQILESNNAGNGQFSEQALNHFRAEARTAGIAAALASMDPAERQRKVAEALKRKAS